MSLSKDDLRIGNIVYKLEMVNNYYRRKKISMIDSEGNEWHRYNRELWTFNVTPLTICGIVKHVVTGSVDSGSILEDEYHVKNLPELDGNPDVYIMGYNQSYLIDDDPSSWTQFFAGMDEAIAAGESFCVNKNS